MNLLDTDEEEYLYTDNISTIIFDEADEILSFGFKEPIYNIIKCVHNYY